MLLPPRIARGWMLAGLVAAGRVLAADLGYTDTPMVRSLGEEYIREKILPQTQLRRLIRPEEIADAICFMISNSAVSGELWADAGWSPQA